MPFKYMIQHYREARAQLHAQKERARASTLQYFIQNHIDTVLLNERLPSAPAQPQLTITPHSSPFDSHALVKAVKIIIYLMAYAGKKSTPARKNRETTIWLYCTDIMNSNASLTHTHTSSSSSFTV